MTQEQKAKAYDKALERATNIYTGRYKPEKAAIVAEILEDVFPKLKESGDERIRKELIDAIQGLWDNDALPMPLSVKRKDEWIAWLEQQGEKVQYYKEESPFGYSNTYIQQKDYAEQKPTIIPKFRVGDVIQSCFNEQAIHKIVRVEDGIYILSSGGYVRIEFQDEWKLVEQEPVEHKFKVGDWITNGKLLVGRVLSFDGEYYRYTCDGIEQPLHVSNAYKWHIWTIKDAKDGDVLAAHACYVIFKEIDGLDIKCYCTYYTGYNPSFYVDTLQNKTAFFPATKEQRDLLFQKMKEAGYEWDAEKKELKKIEQKPAWSEEDEKILKSIIIIIENLQFSGDMREKYNHIPNTSRNYYQIMIDWLKSLKPQNKWKPSHEQMWALRTLANTPKMASVTCRKTALELLEQLKKLYENNY